MSASPRRSTFIVPPTPPRSNAPAAPPPAREATPFVIVPPAFAAEDPETLEPHWRPTIDAATD